MSGFIKKMFIGLLNFGGLLTMKCVYMSNQSGQPNIIHKIFEINPSFHVK